MKRLLTIFFSLLVLLAQPIAAHASYFPETAVKSSTKASYMAASAFTTPVASTTDLFEIYGSGTKTIKVQRIELAYYGTGGAAALDECFLLRRSTANTSGTSTTLTNIKMDTNNSAGTAVCKAYTANPTTGTLVGTLATMSFNGQQPVTQSFAIVSPTTRMVMFDASLTNQPIVLRGTSEGVVINFAGVKPQNTNAKLAVVFHWTEE